jgi:DNA-binding NarL/FixJ family response regulator
MDSSNAERSPTPRIGPLADGSTFLAAPATRTTRSSIYEPISPRSRARLAREGRTNPEIGAELYISPRTVEWHLRQVYTKLGISSRKGLRGPLQSPVRETTPV